MSNASQEACATASRLWELEPGHLYFNFAGHAARPRTVVQAIERATGYLVHPERMGDREMLGVAERVRAGIAALIGADPGDVFLTTGASAGMASAALAMDWRVDDEVVYSRSDFPAHHACWEPMARRHRIHLRDVDGDGVWPTTDAIRSAIGPRTRIVSLSHVRFDDGSALDVPAVAEACHRAGALLLLDVSQSCGALPFQVENLGADILVCAGYKYLLGPWGAGFTWLSRRAQASFEAMPGAWIAQDALRFDQLQYLAPALTSAARRLDASESETITNLNLAAFEAAIATVKALGIRHVAMHVSALTDQLMAEAGPGIDWVSPRTASARGPFVCFRGRSAEHIRAVHARLRERNIYVALRNERIRVAPHLTHTSDDISRLAEVLRHEYGTV